MERVDLRKEIDRLMMIGCPDRAQEIMDYVQSFPDCYGVETRWGLAICSRSVNAAVDHVQLDHQLIQDDGCPLEVWVYAVVGKNDRLYADPPVFVVADAARGFGFIPRFNWYSDMTKAGVCGSVIARVEDYLERHPPVSYSDCEESP